MWKQVSQASPMLTLHMSDTTYVSRQANHLQCTIDIPTNSASLYFEYFTKTFNSFECMSDADRYSRPTHQNLVRRTVTVI